MKVHGKNRTKRAEQIRMRLHASRPRTITKTDGLRLSKGRVLLGSQYEPSTLIKSRDGRTFYEVQKDGSWRKLPAEVCIELAKQDWPDEGGRVETQTEKAPVQLPAYKSHKIVHAAKILGISPAFHPGGAPAAVVELMTDAGQLEVPEAYMAKHKPEIGGYYVRYADGYESYSPAKAFEEGYALVQAAPPRDEAFVAEKRKAFPILAYFQYEHLPERLQNISRPFGDLAWQMACAETSSPAETAAGLRKLLEAKDCAVRAALSPRS